MSIHKTEAIVLNKWDFGETSLIAHFYTRGFGKISGILKGIRDEPGKFASSMELFSYNDIIFYKKTKTALHLVSQCDTRDNFDAIRRNIGAVYAASSIIELLGVVMPEEEKNEDIFDLAKACLGELGNGNIPEKIATIFKIKALTLTGFKPHLDSCVCCLSRIDGQAKFSFALGGLLCSRCFTKDLKSRSIYRGTIASILHIEKSLFRDALKLGMNPQIKKELYLILNSFLKFHLEKELKSEKGLNKLCPQGATLS